MTYLWMFIDHSSEQSIPQTVVTSNGQNLSLKGWIFALEQSWILVDQFAIVDYSVIQVEKFVVLCDDTYTGVGGPNWFCLVVSGERSGLVFGIHAVVEYFIGFGSEDKRFWRSLKINNFFIFVQRIIGLCKGFQIQIASNQRILPCTKNTSLIATVRIQSSIIEQQNDKPIDSCKFLDCGMSFSQ